MSLNKLTDIIENHHKYQQRLAFFKTFGYDIEREREIIFEQAQPVSGSILEDGTGKGHFAIALAQKGHHLTSVDVSEEEQKYARMNAQYFDLQGHIDFQVSDAGNLKFEDRSFDVIFAVNVFHHLESPDNVVDEMIRVCKDSGKIIISDFNKKGMELIAEIHRSEGREHPWGKAVLQQIGKYLEKRNFSVQRHETVFQETIAAYKKKEKGK